MLMRCGWCASPKTSTWPSLVSTPLGALFWRVLRPEKSSYMCSNVYHHLFNLHKPFEASPASNSRKWHFWSKIGRFGQKLAVLGPFLHRWVHFSDEFCVQSSPPTCVPMCTTICSTCTSHLGPPRPPMAKKSILGPLPEPIFERPP